MANVKQAEGKRLKMAERAQQLLDIHFPNMPKEFLWTRKDNHGFTTVPRTLPIVMQAIDMRSTKGQPAGHTLFCLWARSPDNPLVVIENPSIFAAEAGFTGERAVDTWKKRMKKLRELMFIDCRPGVSGEFHYVLLQNPNAIMERLNREGKVQVGLYSRFRERLAEIGAYGEIEAVDQFWKNQAAAQAAAQAQATQVVPPPPPAPLPPPPPPTAPANTQ